MKISQVQTFVLLAISLPLSACNASREQPRDKAHKVAVATVESKDVTLTQPYVGQIRSHHRIEVRAPKSGILEAIEVKAGQTVKQNDLLFQVRPTLGKEQPDVENGDKMVSITAPFEGMVGRLPSQGSLVRKGETLTTLSDDSAMWVYFNIPEARYLEFKSDNLDSRHDDLKIELVLQNGNKFDQPGKLGAIGAGFNRETGHIAFRADFPNPNRLLRDGQIGTVLIGRVRKDAIVIPQSATLEFLEKRYVYVVDKDHVAHQREIVIRNETEDGFVVEDGLHIDDNIVVDGVRRIRDGDKVKYDDPQPKTMAANVK